MDNPIIYNYVLEKLKDKQSPHEFWNVYEIPDNIQDVRKLLRKFEYKYNFQRPHQALNYLTPMEFYNNMIKKVS